MIEFKPFGKLYRLSREVVISEKIDGTNASIFIPDEGPMLFGSRSRWITPENDNAGFARWATANKDALLTLGPGHHFGEWWGQGIQRGYGLKEKRFSLLNSGRWVQAGKAPGEGQSQAPACCHVVPVLWSGIFSTSIVDDHLFYLKQNGSAAAPGFMQPEGVVVFHVPSQAMFKKTLDKNDGHKGEPK